MVFACPDGAALAAGPGRPVLRMGEAVLGRAVATAALALGAFEGRWQRPRFMVVGAAMVSLSVLSANPWASARYTRRGCSLAWAPTGRTPAATDAGRTGHDAKRGERVTLEPRGR